jgi:uncharacterized protein YehS (DUF1456 family)
VLRAAGETETTQENIQDWLQLDEGGPGFQLLTEEEGLEQEDFQTVLRAAGDTETTQQNIQDWLQLDEGGPGFQLLTEEEIAAVIFFLFIFISTTYIIMDMR